MYMDDIMLEKNEAASTYNFALLMSEWTCVTGTSVAGEKMTALQSVSYTEELLYA